MKNVNIGVANLIICNKLNESYLNNEILDESRKTATKLLDIVKKSPILQLEFKVYNNIQNKIVENEVLAKEYIDKHIELFEVYTLEEIEAERKKLQEFLTEEVLGTITEANYDLEKIDLYNAIDTLVTESLKNSEDVDVDELHEAFTFVFNHVRSPKVLTENVEAEPVNEEVIEIAVDKFNEKYASLDENDKELLKTLIKADWRKKKTLLETYKTETLEILEGIDKDNVQDNIKKAIDKIKEMVYDKKTVDDNIIGLHELKKELL